MPDSRTTLATLVQDAPARARVLDRLGLDYCCHGARSLHEACADAGLDEDDVLAQLAASVAGAAVGAGDAVAWRDLDAPALADHLVATHHAYLHDELPALDALSAKVTEVHGANHPELAEVRRLYLALKDDLEPHLMKEERVLFPAIHAIADGARDLPFGSVQNPIRMMHLEHERAGELLERLRAATADFRVPDDGCASYHALYARLEQLEHDTHMHIFKENQLLFPKALAL